MTASVAGTNGSVTCATGAKRGLKTSDTGWCVSSALCGSVSWLEQRVQLELGCKTLPSTAHPTVNASTG